MRGMAPPDYASLHPGYDGHACASTPNGLDSTRAVATSERHMGVSPAHPVSFDTSVSAASAPFPKFVIHCGTLLHELRKQRGTSKYMILVPLFDLKFLNELAARI